MPGVKGPPRMRKAFIIAGLMLFSSVLALIGWFVSADLLIPLPELARDLPRDIQGAQTGFSDRVASRFPAGTDERRVRETLVAQGFMALPNADAMAWVEAENKPTFLCNLELVVTWSAVAGHLTEPAKGHYRPICL